MDEKDITIEVRRSISKTREAHGLSQRGLAKKMGVASSIISRIESGEAKIKVDTLYAIADALKEPPEVLLGSYSEEFLQLWAAFRCLPPEQQQKVLETAEELAELQQLRLARSRNALDP